MRNWIWASLTGSLMAILIGCSAGQNIEIEVIKPLTFAKDAETPFEIKVTEDGEPVEGLKITGELSMVNMDQSKVKATFVEGAGGFYSTNVKLPMAGDWEVVYKVQHNGKPFEKIEQYKVEKSKGVATINGELITYEDIEFYKFINKLHIAITRAEGEKNLTGEKLDEARAYWDSQEKQTENQNSLLTQMIRLRAMAELGKEKGYTATDEEVSAAIEAVRTQYSAKPVAAEMIKEFGEDRFWNIQTKQYKLIVLSEKVQQDLMAEVKKENPNVNDQEIAYLAQKKYEELLVSKVNSLDIKIF
jgi:hypothetical protein